MKREVGPDRRPVTADLAGLPADELAEMLEHILSEDGAPHSPSEPEIPAAFAHGGDPYSLEELLSGLEPALLPSELEPPAGWTSDEGRRHDDDGSPSTAAAEPEPEPDSTTQALGAVAAALQALNEQDTPAPTDAAEAEPDDSVLELTVDMEIAEPEPKPDSTTQALGAVAAALQALNEQDTPAPTDAAEAEPDDSVLELTGDMEIGEPEPEPDSTTQALGAVATALQALNEQDTPAPTDAAEVEPDDSVLELTGDMEIGEPEAEPDSTTQTLGAVAAALQALAGQDAPAAETEVEAEASPDDDVLVLTDDFLATATTTERKELTPPPAPSRKAGSQGDPAWDPTSLTLGNLVAALHALAEDGAPPPRAPAIETAPVAPLSPEPAAPAEPAALSDAEADPEPEPAQPAAAIDEDVVADLTARVEAIIAAHRPDGTPALAKGDATLPDNLDALATLLADPPPTRDFIALDALTACWPKGTHDSESRALLAVAQNLSRNFGLPNKLPMASARAWRMLSPQVFEAELAQRLANVGTFIADWQKTQRTFLILEFGEIELVEQLFEALHLGYHAELLAGVMNFKVLSNRRMGLLRRIPTRVKKMVTPLLPDRKEQALIELAHAKALLERVAASGGFAPIVDTATKALEEIEKLMKAVANAGAPPPSPGGGTALGRMG